MAMVLTPITFLSTVSPEQAAAVLAESEYLQQALKHGCKTFEVRFDPDNVEEGQLVTFWESLDAYREFGAPELADRGQGTEGLDLGVSRAYISRR